MAKATATEPIENHLPYRITDSSERTGVDKAGKLVKYTVFHYETSEGDSGTVEIRTDQFTAEAAQQLIEERITELAKLRRLLP